MAAGVVLVPFQRRLTLCVDLTFCSDATKVRQRFWFCFPKALVVFVLLGCWISETWSEIDGNGVVGL